MPQWTNGWGWAGKVQSSFEAVRGLIRANSLESLDLEFTMKFVHIFNGDSSAEAFSESGLAGDRYVWREMLVEGPARGIPGTETFWDTRAHYFATLPEVPEDSYRPQTQQEWNRLAEAPKDAEWVLWYEYDLFCQINLMALLAGIRAMPTPPPKLSLVCVGQQPDGNWVTLGSFAPLAYPSLLETRKPLGRDALAYAVEVWDAWVGADPRQVMAFVQKNHQAFPYLPQALEAAESLFPARGGLNLPERWLLGRMAEGSLSIHSLIGEALRNANHPFGMGDLQWLYFLKGIGPLWVKQGDLVQLSPLGGKVHQQKEVFVGQLEGRYIGGAQAAAWQWMPEKGQLEPATASFG